MSSYVSLNVGAMSLKDRRRLFMHEQYANIEQPKTPKKSLSEPKDHEGIFSRPPTESRK